MKANNKDAVTQQAPNHVDQRKEDNPPEQHHEAEPSNIHQQPAAEKIQRNQNHKSNKHRQYKNEIKTHLTTTRVCTVLCPETSGT